MSLRIYRKIRVNGNVEWLYVGIGYIENGSMDTPKSRYRDS
jgi:hypothetical protein